MPRTAEFWYSPTPKGASLWFFVAVVGLVWLLRTSARLVRRLLQKPIIWL